MKGYDAKISISRSNKSSLFDKGINYPEYQNIVDDKQARIYEFIKQKPGLSKEDVVRHFTDLSRVTVFKNLKLLEEKDLIIISNNPKNRQTHCININENSILMKVNNEILEFKYSIFKVLDRLDNHFIEIGFNKSQSNMDDNIQYIFTSLREIFDEYVRFYFSRAMLQWQNNNLTDQIRFKLYDVVIKNTIEIQRRLSEFFPTGLYDEEVCHDNDEDIKRINMFSAIGLEAEINGLIRATQELRFNYRKNRADYS